jgi:hypothetical protein
MAAQLVMNAGDVDARLLLRRKDLALGTNWSEGIQPGRGV